MNQHFFFKLLFAFPSIVQQDLSGNKTLVWLICNLRKLKITGWLWSFEFFVLVTKYSKTRCFSHSSASAIFSCQIAIWRFFTKTVVDYYARENGEKKLAWFVSFQNCFSKVFEDRKIPSIRIQIHYGILDSTKTILVEGDTVITRSVSSLEFFGREE